MLGLLGLDSGLIVVTAISGKVGIAHPMNGWGMSMLGNPAGSRGFSGVMCRFGDCVMTNSSSSSIDLGLSSEALVLF